MPIRNFAYKDSTLLLNMVVIIAMHNQYLYILFDHLAIKLTIKSK